MRNRASGRKGKTVFLLSTATIFCLCAVFAAGCFASEGGEAVHHAVSAAQLKDFGWRILNFSIICIILAWAVKKANVKGLLADRRESVRKALQDAADAREAADRKYREYTEKLEKASHEIDAIYDAIKREAEAEKERILAEATVMAERIKEQAASVARQEILRARRELREEAARLSVEVAAKTLRETVEKADQDRFVDEFIDDYLTKVEKAH